MGVELFNVCGLKTKVAVLRVIIQISGYMWSRCGVLAVPTNKLSIFLIIIHS